jgi:hypothetical protein
MNLVLIISGVRHAHGREMNCFQVQAASIMMTLPSRSALMSRIGGWPKNRLYSRLNWLTLSYQPRRQRSSRRYDP